jgi:hypothetical protein
MTATPAASLADLLLGLAAPTDQEPNNRFTVEGLTLAAAADGATEVRIRKVEASSLHLESGPLLLRVEQLALQEVVATVRIGQGRPRLVGLQAASAELTGGKGRAPVVFPAVSPTSTSTSTSTAGAATAGPWSLGPLAAAQGTVRAQIVDAHLMFDADVTVPIREGGIDFNKATVEHVGPDSRMGVSRMGLYVDAPNGRSYLYQFPSTPVAGVEYEKRGAMLGPFVTSRGSLRLQAFSEALLRQPRGGRFHGFTEQARLLFDRTAVSGDLQPGDGTLQGPGVHAELAGAGQGRNLLRLHSEAVGRGITAEIASLLVRDAGFSVGDTQLHCDEITGALQVRFHVDDGQLRFEVEVRNLKLAGLRMQSHPATAA